MAFPWEVEALRKVLDTILEKTDAMEPWEKRNVRSDQDEAYIREVSGRGPDEEVPDNLMVDEQGNIWDWEEHFKLSEEERARSVRDSIDAYTKRHEIHEKGDKLKLDWVNEILKEFPEDKAPEVLRLPQWKDEEKTGMSPFLSYLLRQSPYARLPAAGLLAAGLMGYSKPAY